MTKAFIAQLMSDAVRVIGDCVRHGRHPHEEWFGIKAQFRCELLPLSAADIVESVFPSKSHGKPDSVGIEIRIRQDAREIVKRSQSDLPPGTEQESVVLRMRIGAGNQPVECDGVQEAAGVVHRVRRIRS